MRPSILLDRDGTIIAERHYLSDPNQVALERNAAAGLRALIAETGYPLVVVSNQSGIGRGYFTIADADRVNERVGDLLASEGVTISGWYMCPHAPDEPCQCRKPLPGLAKMAAQDLGLDLARSVVIGDKRSDVEFAVNIGARGILLRTGHGEQDVAWCQANGHPVAHDLLAAARIVQDEQQAGLGSREPAR